jgi:hypothetical protein
MRLKREIERIVRPEVWLKLWLVMLASWTLLSIIVGFSDEPMPRELAAVFRVEDIEVQNQIQMTNASGPTVKVSTSNPNGVVTEPRGSLRMRTDAANANLYLNTNAGTTWRGILDTFTSTVNGMVPASGGGTVNYLRADGTWQPPGLDPTVWQYGDGRDGDLNFDCVNNVTLGNGTVLSPLACDGVANSCYFLLQDVQAHNITVANNCAVTAPNRIMATGTINLNGANALIHCDGQKGGVGGTHVAGLTCGSGNLFDVGANGGAGVNNAQGGGTSGANTPRREPSSAGGGFTGGSVAGVATSCSVGTTAPQVIGRAGGGGGGNNTNCGGACAGNSGGSVTQAPTAGGAATFTGIWTGHQDVLAGPIRWTGGSGGGGGGSVAVGSSGGGGGGGGGWVVVRARILTGTGRISARGGNGASATGANAGGGGGGGGGYAAVYYGTKGASVVIDAAGGTAGSGVGTGFAGANGCAGNAWIYNLSGDGT